MLIKITTCVCVCVFNFSIFEEFGVAKDKKKRFKDSIWEYFIRIKKNDNQYLKRKHYGKGKKEVD